jgi:hypothetical protein
MQCQGLTRSFLTIVFVVILTLQATSAEALTFNATERAMPARRPMAESLDTPQLLCVLTVLRKDEFLARLPRDSAPRVLW